MFQNNESSGGQVVGGFIVGVASKIDRSSLKVYKGGVTYKQWEFIYNPLEQVQTFGGGTSMIPAGSLNLGAYGNCTSANPCNSPPQPPQPQIPH